MRSPLVGVALALCCAGGAQAANATVTFSGTLTSSCSLSINTPGVLALSTDGTTLGSQEAGGASAVVAIVALGTNTVTVAPPTLSSSPAGYDAGSGEAEVAYAGLSGLSGVSGVSQAYTTSSTSFPVSALATIAVNNRVVNSAGFAPGNYTTQTVLTCS
jgi:hypothetical protein